MHEPVTVYTSRGRKLEAVASTEHAQSSHGLPVVLVDDEPLGPADLLPGPAGTVEAIVAVEAADPAVRTALLRAGFVVREPASRAPLRVSGPAQRPRRRGYGRG